MTLSWDRDNMSVRTVTSLFAAADIALSHNIDELTLSRSSVHRSRVKNREEIAVSLTGARKYPWSFTETGSSSLISQTANHWRRGSRSWSLGRTLKNSWSSLSPLMEQENVAETILKLVLGEWPGNPHHRHGVRHHDVQYWPRARGVYADRTGATLVDVPAPCF